MATTGASAMRHHHARLSRPCGRHGMALVSVGQILKVLHKILDDGAEPVMLLGLISYNFRRLMMVSSMMSNGVERSEVARVMNLRYNDQEDFLRTARRIGTHSLANILKRIAETDLALKSSIGGGGPKGSRMLIETLVCELALA